VLPLRLEGTLKGEDRLEIGRRRGAAHDPTLRVVIQFDRAYA